jgi:NAD(P)-dependent dehydrogenase (short-subunit alcohol dehydrogenase family)
MQTASPVALATGASSGIGRAAALALVDAGFAVVGKSRSAANAGPLAGVTLLDLDVASDESVRSVVEEVSERFGRIDVLVNNAGVGAGEESSINQTKDRHQRLRPPDVGHFLRVEAPEAIAEWIAAWDRFDDSTSSAS